MFERTVGYFRRHPVLLLLGLTPGIPEYLSGSSPVAGVVVAPGLFALFLALNLGLYGGGVLLLREAWVRWRKGWAALLLFGTAYGLLEEGTALSTLFDPHASVVGGLGSYGRFAGVNWVWTVGVLEVHTVLSVGLPLALLALALPETRGRPLLGRTGMAVAAVLYAATVVVLVLAVGYWRTAWPLLAGAAIVAGALIVVARRLPADLLDPPTDRPASGPALFFVSGLAFFPALLLVPAISGILRAPAAAAVVVDLLATAMLFAFVRSRIGRREHDQQLVALALGSTLPVAFFGLLGLPLELGVDAVYALFFYALWRRYAPVGGSDGGGRSRIVQGIKAPQSPQ